MYINGTSAYPGIEIDGREEQRENTWAGIFCNDVGSNTLSRAVLFWNAF